MVGNALIPEELLKSMLKEVAGVDEARLENHYCKMVLEDLEFGSSLIRRTWNEGHDFF